jgi:uncharacterized repeat protein (TIGR03803 family)
MNNRRRFSLVRRSPSLEPEITMLRRSYGFVYLVFIGSTACALPSGAATLVTQPSPGYAVLYRFQGVNDGAGPSGLVTDAAGALYGTTVKGGRFGKGTAFKLTPTGSTYAETVLHHFTGLNDGQYPNAALLIDKNGALFGVTQQGGGTPGYGTVFKLTPTGRRYAESIVYRFQGGNDGAYPEAALIVDKSGALYGTTVGGFDRRWKRRAFRSHLLRRRFPMPEPLRMRDRIQAHAERIGLLGERHLRV